MASISTILNEGVAELQKGRSAEAAKLFRRAVERAPNHPDAVHLLGVALYQQGDTDGARRLVERAIRLKPAVADYHSNLGRFQLSLGNLEAALAHARRAVELNPDHAAAHFNTGSALTAMGKKREATVHLRRYIALAPRDPGGHHQLGTLLSDLYEPKEAAECFRRALELNPALAESHNNLGNALQSLGRPAEAIPCYEEALRLRPAYPDAASNMGAALQAMLEFDKAAQWYDEALRMEPGFLQARGNMANLLAARRRHGEAIHRFRELLVEMPDSIETWNNMGNSLQELGRYGEALEAYNRALAINPAYYLVHNNIGNTLRRQGRGAEAVASYDRALAQSPEFIEAINNKAVALQDMGKHPEAIALFERAMEIRPGYVDPLINLSNHWRDHGRPETAIGLLRRARELQPENAYVWNNLGCSLSDQGLVPEAIDCYRQAFERMPDNFQAHSNLLLNLHYLDGATPDEIFERHREFARRFETPLARPRQHANTPIPGRTLRVGYVSADFRRHSVAFFFEPILERHDRGRFEVFCYADVARPDPLTARFREMAGAGWREIRGANHEAFAEAVRGDGIDILVDLGGHTANSRLLSFATKPAPVQVSYLGYPDTTGLDAMDYRITDPWADPAGQTERWHTERLFRMEQGFLCYRPPADSPGGAPPPSAGGTGTFTFGCFNNMAKVGPGLVAAWAEILGRAPGSRLAVKNKALSEPEAQNRLAAAFAARGIDPARVLMSGLIPSLHGHLDAYRMVDLALDTHPYAGTTTTFEALWMGVPVLSRPGLAHASRVGASLLSLLGLPWFLAANEADYIDKAVECARNPDRTGPLRAELRDRLSRSALMDEAGFVRRLESAYRLMWENWCRHA